MHKKRSSLLYLAISFLLLYSIFTSFFTIFSFPEQINVIQGQSQKIRDSILFNFVLDKNGNNSINLLNAKSNISSLKFLQGNNEGTAVASLKLLGIVPVKKVTLNVIPDIKVTPSGEAIGVKIESEGLLVVGLSSLMDKKGKKCSPAADAGFEIGDILISVNDVNIEKEKDIIDILNNRASNETQVRVKVKRKSSLVDLTVKPVKCSDNIFKIGLWVRDNIAGVGTMTFYESNSGKFGALGHGITDIDSGVLININKGYILKSKVASIQKARKAVPGELVGIFYENEGPYGVIQKNTPFGIYGKIESSKLDLNRSSMPIGLNSEIKEGPAKILTTIEGNTVQEFDIDIQKVTRQRSADSKSMIIKVTDPELLEKTGGIVQGMSGSPIIQNGKLIGAITHVLVNDPTRGYGISIEWMLNECNIR